AVSEGGGCSPSWWLATATHHFLGLDDEGVNAGVKMKQKKCSSTQPRTSDGHTMQVCPRHCFFPFLGPTHQAPPVGPCSGY
ncbi:hypothetical protein CSUI_006152, partial [Cystoisospora suis]